MGASLAKSRPGSAGQNRQLHVMPADLGCLFPPCSSCPATLFPNYLISNHQSNGRSLKPGMLPTPEGMLGKSQETVKVRSSLGSEVKDLTVCGGRIIFKPSTQRFIARWAKLGSAPPISINSPSTAAPALGQGPSYCRRPRRPSQGIRHRATWSGPMPRYKQRTKALFP